MQEDGVHAFFAGAFTHRIDAKGRISIPARWRSEFRSDDSPHLYVTPATAEGGSAAIECVTQSDLRRRNSEHAGRTDLSQHRRGLLGLHHFHAYAALPVDPEGRVQLPLEALTVAGLTLTGNPDPDPDRNPDRAGRKRRPARRPQDAVLLGAGDRFYILHPDQVAGFLAAAAAEAERVDNDPGPGL